MYTFMHLRSQNPDKDFEIRFNGTVFQRRTHRIWEPLHYIIIRAQPLVPEGSSSFKPHARSFLCKANNYAFGMSTTSRLCALRQGEVLSSMASSVLDAGAL